MYEISTRLRYVTICKNICLNKWLPSDPPPHFLLPIKHDSRYVMSEFECLSLLHIIIITIVMTHVYLIKLKKKMKMIFFDKIRFEIQNLYNWKNVLIYLSRYIVLIV